MAKIGSNINGSQPVGQKKNWLCCDTANGHYRNASVIDIILTWRASPRVDTTKLKSISANSCLGYDY